MQTKFVGFETIKRSVSMAQILDRYGLLEGLHQSGDNLNGPCPLHAGRNPSQFRVSTRKNCWICFGDCHIGGSIIDFVSRKEGVGIRDAARLIQEWFGVHANGEPQSPAVPLRAHPEPAGCEVNELLNFTLNGLDARHPYLLSRGLSMATMRTFGVGYCRSGALAGWVAIPIHNGNGELIAYAGRWPGQPPEGTPKYKLPKGFRKSLEVFNLHRAKEADARLPLVVVEGFFGCMKVWEAGHHRVVALMGSSLSAAQQEHIERTVGPGGRVLLLFDEDEAGRRGATETQARLDEIVDARVVRFGVEGAQPDNQPAERLLEMLAAT